MPILSPKQKKKDVTLFCFSPEVMLATFVIEVAIAIYVRVKYGMTRLSQYVILTLICLAVFQGVEYQICAAGGTTFWTKIGLAAITLLPPLGIHLVSVLSGRKRFLTMGYLLALAYIGAFVLIAGVVDGSTCGGNYVILHTLPTTMYGFYYVALLLLGVSEAMQARKLPGVSTKNREALGWLIVGYASFMVPMAVVYVLMPHAREGAPSIMCGFAIVLAFILGFRVMAIGSDAAAPTKKIKQ